MKRLQAYKFKLAPTGEQARAIRRYSRIAHVRQDFLHKTSNGAVRPFREAGTR